MVSFKTIRARAAKRKGGDAALAELLPKLVGPKALAKLKDDPNAVFFSCWVQARAEAF